MEQGLQAFGFWCSANLRFLGAIAYCPYCLPLATPMNLKIFYICDKHLTSVGDCFLLSLVVRLGVKKPSWVSRQ